ncbi:hypothetical protein [Sphingomonas radiodurans]|uniref:hypothetical protein n=1 Tax=Sphingomonas radiodurans TaxID=2890321 RepID=UPI001E36DB39|nr:hypothetical protein [Sphingomonas radiodurans]WBH16190.1 hypothetical protein LLW23_15490 [Sphingomonas radiodurans]
MNRIGPEAWLEAERLEKQTSRSRSKRMLAGVYSPAPFVVLPAIASLPIMAVAGEGDYIIPVLGTMWAVLAVVAAAIRKRFEERTTSRACATGVMVQSTLLCLLMLLMTIAFATEGSWR